MSAEFPMNKFKLLKNAQLLFLHHSFHSLITLKYEKGLVRLQTALYSASYDTQVTRERHQFNTNTPKAGRFQLQTWCSDFPYLGVDFVSQSVGISFVSKFYDFETNKIHLSDT